MESIAGAQSVYGLVAKPTVAISDQAAVSDLRNSILTSPMLAVPVQLVAQAMFFRSITFKTSLAAGLEIAVIEALTINRSLSS